MFIIGTEIKPIKFDIKKYQEDLLDSVRDYFMSAIGQWIIAFAASTPYVSGQLTGVLAEVQSRAGKAWPSPGGYSYNVPRATPSSRSFPKNKGQSLSTGRRLTSVNLKVKGTSLEFRVGTRIPYFDRWDDMYWGARSAARMAFFNTINSVNLSETGIPSLKKYRIS